MIRQFINYNIVFRSPDHRYCSSRPTKVDKRVRAHGFSDRISVSRSRPRPPDRETGVERGIGFLHAQFAQQYCLRFAQCAILKFLLSFFCFFFFSSYFSSFFFTYFIPTTYFHSCAKHIIHHVTRVFANIFLETALSDLLRFAHTRASALARNYKILPLLLLSKVTHGHA